MNDLNNYEFEICSDTTEWVWLRFRKSKLFEKSVCIDGFRTPTKTPIGLNQGFDFKLPEPEMINESTKKV